MLPTLKFSKIKQPLVMMEVVTVHGKRIQSPSQSFNELVVCYFIVLHPNFWHYLLKYSHAHTHARTRNSVLFIDLQATMLTFIN